MSNCVSDSRPFEIVILTKAKYSASSQFEPLKNKFLC